MNESSPGVSRVRAVLRWLRLLMPWVVVALAIGAVPTWRLLAPTAARPHHVEHGSVVERAFGRGTIEGDREAQLGFDLVGTLSEVLVDEGDRVRLGQELARLRPEKYAAEVRTATSGLKAARATLGRLAAEERKAREALALAVREERRLRALVEAQVAPTQELDLATDESRSARTELDRVLGLRREATRGIEVASGVATEREVTELRATLLAPFDGLVVRRFRDPGDAVTIGTSVLRLVDVDALIVRAWVDETMLPRLSEEQRVEVIFPAEPGRPYVGRVQRVGYESDRQTHELLVDVALVEGPSRVAIGQRADAWIELERQEDVACLPIGLLQHDSEGVHVWVDARGRIERRPVVLGLQGREIVEVTTGLVAGEIVLAPLRPGGELKVGRRWRALP